MDLLNKPSITIEIGSSVAPCPYWQYEIEFQKNRYVVVRIAKCIEIGKKSGYFDASAGLC